MIRCEWWLWLAIVVAVGWATAQEGRLSESAPIFLTSNRDAKDRPLHHIYAMAWDGSNVRRVAKEPMAVECDPALSPDGKQIAFVAVTEIRQKGPKTALFVMNVDGAHRRQLTRGDEIVLHPAWSPNGSRLAFTAIKDWPLSEPRIEIIKADGTERRPLRHLGSAAEPSWHPDGERIAFVVDRPSPDVAYALKVGYVEPGMPTALISETAQNASWSPDGRMIADRPPSSDAVGRAGYAAVTLFTGDATRLSIGFPSLPRTVFFDQRIRWVPAFCGDARGFLSPSHATASLGSHARRDLGVCGSMRWGCRPKTSLASRRPPWIDRSDQTSGGTST
jgi:Tol biopolymer transport system component